MARIGITGNRFNYARRDGRTDTACWVLGQVQDIDKRKVLSEQPFSGSIQDFFFFQEFPDKQQIIFEFDLSGRDSAYFTSSISFPKLFTTSYLTFSGAYFLLISSKNLRAHLILVFSISLSTIEDIEPLVSATK